MSGKKRVGVLISGRGSNMAALAEACMSAEFPAEIAIVISNNPEAEGISAAQSQALTAKVIDHRDYKNRAAFDAALSSALQAARVEIVCNAGFMRLHTPDFVREWAGRQINIHPSLLPSFRGLHPHRQALQAGVRISGATVHFVTEEADAGPIIAQAAVPVLPDDTEHSLAERILRSEHRLYPYALALVARGDAVMEGGQAKVSPHARPFQIDFNP